ncbi:MAG: AMP-binding protein [Pseudomonadota bacterium]
MGWTSMTMGQMLDRVSEQYPNKTAIISEEQRISYADLKEHVEQVALAFLALGIKKGDKVSVWLCNCLEWIYIQFALGKIGGILVPINTRFKVKELEYTLNQSDSRVLVTMDRFLNVEFAKLAYETIPELNASIPGKLHSERFPILECVICLGNPGMPGMLPWEEFLAGGVEPGADLLIQRQREVEPDDVAMFQYTSGTTSFPKGVMLTHNSIIRDSYLMGQRMTIESEDRLFCPLPFFHVGGAVISTLLALSNGATLVICETYDPESAMKMMEREHCTAMNGIETHFLMIYQHPDFYRYDLSSLEKGWAIGQPEIIRAIYEKMGMEKILNVYGISEASPNVTTTQIDDPLDFRIEWHGKPHPETEIKIVDYETGGIQPPLQEGELCVRGWNVMKGYYKNPEETRAAIDEEGWLHTGDSGIMDNQGNLKFTGRIKDMVRVGGENVSSMEVENFLLTHPKVKNVSVIGVPDKLKTEVCMAVVQLKEGEKATEEEIIEYCRGKIANFKIPKYVRFIEEYPMTGSGKIQKFVLKERFGDFGR